MSTRPAQTPIEAHPDLMALRAHYEEASETPLARTLYGLTCLAGLYAAISPWVVKFSVIPYITVNNLIVGLAVAVMALGFASAYGRTHNLAWTTPVLGVWLIISPWVILQKAATTGLIASNVIVGAIILLLGAGVASLGMTRQFG
ncbi:SPW repeat protein [Gandjariella thermophila]|uniref:SPW repeat-containing integral membrane domain-containing protein n=1 Tax=Gandjariella thermophila TaxID=1931992 RepID=A0A4D4JAD2_9PSEU|nr:SPW repeat protein [Gandjariella thermophila]GDY30897.1 hypothetical protein GTS_25300 [Gandjariella thermophila]